MLKETHPKLYEYCMKSWDEGGLGMKDVLEFIGVKIGTLHIVFNYLYTYYM